MYFALLAVFLSAVLVYVRGSSKLRRNLPYPPGPSPTFIIGNLFDLPKSRAWLTYSQWKNQYGPIVHFRVFNQHFIVPNTLEAANELLTRRSALYSDRPSIPMVELTGWDRNFALLPYGEAWRKCRRIGQQVFKADSALNYQLIQTRKVRDMLEGLLMSPDRWMEHNRTLSAAIIMSLLYGYDIAPTNDYYVSIAEHALENLGQAIFPGSYIVNAIPAMRHLPSWFEFHKFAKKTRDLVDAMRDKPLEFVKRNLAQNTGRECLLGNLMQKSEDMRLEGKEDPHPEEILKILAQTTYAGGADTTVSSLGTFIYAMTLNPRVVEKAQEELDRIVGRDRLPTHEDAPNLPYIEAILRETFRFRPVLPLGLPHKNIDRDLYNEYYIPKGSVIWPNVWAITRDEIAYPDAETFIPERFINPDGSLTDDDMGYTFGFGRRVCVGRHLAHGTMWLAVASILATFNIFKAKDAEGKEIPIVDDYADGLLVRHTRPFPCAITPRSDAVALIKDTTVLA
ncbi:cytochrome P450 [Mycena floridula]|nr:cytochrome P450 [Mycena floridula]